MGKVREVYFFYFTSSGSESYIPLAPASKAASSLSLCNVYNLQMIPLYNQKKEQVGFITWTGASRNNPLLDDGSESVAVFYETAIVYITSDKSLKQDKILGSLTYSYSYLADGVNYTYRKGDVKISSPNSVSGKYIGKKNLTVSDSLINEKQGKFELIVEYDA